MARRQVLAIALAAALLALLALRLPGAPARGQPTANPAPAPPSAPPVYVLGPQSLVEAVERAGLNAVPITTADLSKIPNGSVVVVDWAQLETARGAPNLTSPAVQALEGIFARGGLVLANSSDPVAAELLLSYAAARAAGVKFGDPLPGGGARPAGRRDSSRRRGPEKREDDRPARGANPPGPSGLCGRQLGPPQVGRQPAGRNRYGRSPNKPGSLLCYIRAGPVGRLRQ
ncbi:MAG: hypothetical protein AT715_05615 [Thermoproteus sp. JCHS_4]|nr:MAG: hypothetical protein AT715_05615 [Thermoproteus sp. JCHS_4]